MKRFIVTAILIVVIASVMTYFMPRSFDKYALTLSDNATISIYCRQTNLDGVDMGCGYKVTCKTANFSEVARQCSNIDGISVTFEGDYTDVLNLRQFFALDVLSVYEQDGLYVVCGKSPRICNEIVDCGQAVNLQIAYRDGLIHVGSPLILGDY